MDVPAATGAEVPFDLATATALCGEVLWLAGEMEVGRAAHEPGDQAVPRPLATMVQLLVLRPSPSTAEEAGLSSAHVAPLVLRQKSQSGISLISTSRQLRPLCRWQLTAEPVMRVDRDSHLDRAAQATSAHLLPSSC
jgi:hypothetical protein